MRINQNHVFMAKRFSYNEGLKRFSADISDLVGRGFFNNLAKPLYDDAADLGFGIINGKTQKTVYFVFSHEDSNDGSIECFHFTSIPSEVCLFPLHCVIYND